MADEAYGLWPLVIVHTAPSLKATHAGGHIWSDLIGWQGDPHLSPFHLASYAAIGGGFWLIAAARFGPAWDSYADATPAFWPHLPTRVGRRS